MADTDAADSEALAQSKFGQVPVEITISVGTARPLIKDLLSLGSDGVIPLDRALDDPVDLYVGDVLIAHGELEEIDGEGSGKIGVRITEVTAAAREL